jgi:hypothetical protein
MTEIGMSHRQPNSERVRTLEPSPDGLEVAGTRILADLSEAGKSPHNWTNPSDLTTEAVAAVAGSFSW